MPIAITGNSRSHQLSRPPSTLSLALAALGERLGLSPGLLRYGILGRGYLGSRVPLPLLGEVFSNCRQTEEAHARVWCAVEQRVGTISFLHAWLSLSVGTDRLRG